MTHQVDVVIVQRVSGDRVDHRGILRRQLERGAGSRSAQHGRARSAAVVAGHLKCNPRSILAAARDCASHRVDESSARGVPDFIRNPIVIQVRNELCQRLRGFRTAALLKKPSVATPPWPAR